MTSEEYGQYIDDFELDVDVMPGESLTDYIERRRREFDSKADGGSIGIEVLFRPKRGEYQTGGRTYDSRATAQDFANALKSVSAGTTYQQQADAKRYARQQADEMLRSAMRSADPNKGPGLQGIYDTFFKNKNTGIGSNVFSRGGSGRMISYSSKDRNRILDQMANQMLNTTTYGGGSSAPDPFQKQREELEKIKTENKRIYDEYIKNNPPLTGMITPGQTPKLPPPPYQDQKLLDQLTKLTPLQASYFDPFDKLSDLDQYNLSLAFPELKSQLRNPNQPRLAVMPDPAEIFSRRYGIKDGGRVPMVSGGALKGLMSLFKGGDKAADLAKQEEIFRSGPITAKFLEDVDNKVIDKFVRTRDTKGPGGYGMYDNFDDMPAGLKAAEIVKRFVDRKTGKINYEDAEFFIGRKLKGDETIDELIDIAISKPIGSGKSANLEELMADGGRVGLFMGGDPLTGQALQIYNSMSSYGFSDAEIADALRARGLYDVAPVETPVTNTAPSIINQGSGGEGPSPPGPEPFDKGFSSLNFGLGKDLVNKDAVVDYEAEAYGIGPTFTGTFARALNSLKNIPTPFNIARMGIQKAVNFAKQKELEKKAQEEAIARDNFREAMKQGRGFYDQFGKGDAASSKGREEAGSGFSDVSESGPFKDGGLATMFTRRR